MNECEVLKDPEWEELPPWEKWRANLTTGGYATEEDAKSAFISHVNDDHWYVEQEVTGEVIFPKPDCERSHVRVDYVLFPKPSMIQNGWTAGPICVEVKRSRYKLGDVVNQAMDYMRCVFNGPRGQRFQPKYCIIFPLDRVGETVQSIMANQRVGYSHIGGDGSLRIYLNSMCVYTETGGVFLRRAMKAGKKFGSR